MTLVLVEGNEAYQPMPELPFVCVGHTISGYEGIHHVYLVMDT